MAAPANPRSLPPEEIEDTEGEQADAMEIEVALAALDVLNELFEHSGWPRFAALVQAEEASAIGALLSDQVQSMEQVAAYRGRRRVLRWILDMPTEKARERSRLHGALRALKGEE